MRIYLIFMTATLGLALLMATEDTAILVMLLGGLGAPLIYAATGFAYGLCLYPSIAFWNSRRARGVALSCAALALVALAPGALGRVLGEWKASALRFKDRAPAAPVSATTIEIHRPTQDYLGTFMDQQACGVECRTLLLNGQIRWARIVMDDVDKRAASPPSTFFRLMRGEDCAVPGTQKPESETCVLMAPDSGEAAELTVVIAPQRANVGWPPKRELARLRMTRSVSVFLAREGENSEVFRSTEVDLETPSTPLVLGPEFAGWSSWGVDVLRSLQRVNAITFSGVLSALGYSLALPPGAPPVVAKSADWANWREGVNETMTREMVAALNLPQTAPFNAEQAEVISDWIMHARNIEDWTPSRLALLRRIARDGRLRTPTFFDQIFARRQDVTRTLLPDVLDVIARDGIGSDYTVARQAAYTFPRLDPSLLKPYAARIVALLGKSPETRDILLPAVGRLGVDPTPYLLPLDADAKGFDARIQGACYADKQWLSKLIGPLREATQANKGATGADRDRRRLLLKTLANLGDRDFVENELSTNANIDGTSLRAEIERNANEKVVSDRLCSGW